jgi:thiol:disulfide interchange protein DsbC
MSLMLKLSTTILLSASLFAATEAEVVDYLKKGFSKNPNIVSLELKVVDKIPVKEAKGWEAFIIGLNAKAKVQGKERTVSQRMIYFAKDDLITQELTNIKTGEQLSATIAPAFKKYYYTQANLIVGNADAKHKVAIFSDPLCPFCRRFVPEAVRYMKQYPKEFAVYYYHFPLPTLHPAAVALTKAAIAAEQKGRKGVVLEMYKVEVDSRESDEQKIIDVFNKTLKTDIKVSDIHAAAVEEQFKHDQEVALSLMVQGTPTMFFDGKKDPTKKKFKEVKVK